MSRTAVGGPELAALADGYRAAFGAAAGFAALGLLVALTFFGRSEARATARSR